jgi:hypothetical protein
MSKTSMTQPIHGARPVRGEARARGATPKATAAGPRPAKRFDLRRWLARWRRRLMRPRSVREIWTSMTRRVPAAAGRSQPARKPSPLRELAEELTAQLDRHPHTRAVMPHLALVERGLKRRGAGALPKIHPRHLHKACLQLEILMGTDVSAGLARLHSTLQNQLAEHESWHESAPGSESADEAAHVPVVMHEVTLSTFMDADRQWEAAVASGQAG